MLLFLTFSLLYLLILSSSPLKLSLSLAALSTLMSLLLYQLTNSIFILCALIISFSSGMMILFSYCSMLSNHESKNNIKPTNLILPLSIPLVLLTTNPTSYENMMQKMTMECSQTWLLVFLMIVVIISMVSMNMSFFNPTKKFMQSY